jgi:hypothetical protein
MVVVNIILIRLYKASNTNFCRNRCCLWSKMNNANAYCWSWHDLGTVFPLYWFYTRKGWKCTDVEIHRFRTTYDVYSFVLGIQGHDHDSEPPLSCPPSSWTSRYQAKWKSCRMGSNYFCPCQADRCRGVQIHTWSHKNVNIIICIMMNVYLAQTFLISRSSALRLSL